MADEKEYEVEKTTSKSKKTNETEKTVPLEQFEQLQTQFNQLQQMMMSLMANNMSQQTSVNTLTKPVTIIHLIENEPGLRTHIELSNTTIDFNAFGELRTLDMRQAEELAGKYRKWFDKGVLAFGVGSEDVAMRFGLKSKKDYSYISDDFKERIANMNAIELEALYDQLPEGHKAFIVSYFQRKIIEGNDPRFNNPQKIEMLNRVTAGEDGIGAMSGIILDRQRDAQKPKK